jgi:hypothetical protein
VQEVERLKKLLPLLPNVTSYTASKDKGVVRKQSKAVQPVQPVQPCRSSLTKDSPGHLSTSELPLVHTSIRQSTSVLSIASALTIIATTTIAFSGSNYIHSFAHILKPNVMTRDTPGPLEGRTSSPNDDILAALWAAAPIPRLPRDAPEELKSLTIDIDDPKRLYILHHANRRHNFQLLVERYVAQFSCPRALP